MRKWIDGIVSSIMDFVDRPVQSDWQHLATLGILVVGAMFAIMVIGIIIGGLWRLMF